MIKNHLPLIKRCMFIVGLICMAGVLYSNLNQILNIKWEFRAAYMFLSGVGLLTTLFTGPFGWYLTMSALKRPVSVSQAFQIYTLSAVSRYIPGTIWSYFSRIALTQNLKHLDVGSIMISLIVEQILSLLCSIMIGLPFLLTVSDIPIHPVGMIIAFFILASLINPRIIKLLSYIPGRVGTAVKNVNLPSMRNLFYLFLFYLLHWLIFSFSFLCFIKAIYPIAAEDYIRIVSSFAVAFFIGFIAFLFPGGIGIRESALFFFLSSILPVPVCITVSIGSRIWIMMGEFVAILAALLLYMKKNKTGKVYEE